VRWSVILYNIVNFSFVGQIDALHEKCIYVRYVCIHADAITGHLSIGIMNTAMFSTFQTLKTQSVKYKIYIYISRESKTTRNVLWSCASVCLSVCLSAAACPHYCTDPDVTWGSGRGCPLVVHYWADLQSVPGMRCYGNIMEMRGRAQW